MLDDSKGFFIENEVLNFTIVSGLSRGFPVYKKGVSGKEKEGFHKYLKDGLQDIFPKYLEKVSEEEHIGNLRRFKKKIDNDWKEVINGNEIKFGRVQKLVNIYLKYKWTLGHTSFNPPHCPLDYTVIREIGGKCNWTEMDEEQYRQLAGLASEKWGKGTLSCRELELFNKKNY